MRSCFFISVFLVMMSPLASIAGEESDQLGLVLSELRELRASMARIEERLERLEEQTEDGLPVEGLGSEPASFMERVATAVAVREERINYPWMDRALWDEVEEGMSPEAVKAILGEPTLEDPSLHKRIDTVYTYRGTSPQSGKKLVGRVRFYRGEVVSVDLP